MKWLILGLVALSLVGGGAYFITKNNNGATADQLVKTWTIDTYNNTKIKGGFIFRADGTFGADICNTYGGNYVLKNGTIKFSKVGGTLMVCLNPDLQKAEAGFDKMTENGAKAQIENGVLKLQNGGNVFLLN